MARLHLEGRGGVELYRGLVHFLHNSRKETTQSSNPWPTAAEQLNRHVSQDPELGAALARLTSIQTRQQRLATKLEEGRIFGLRQQVFDRKLRRQLDRMNVPSQEMW